MIDEYFFESFFCFCNFIWWCFLCVFFKAVENNDSLFYEEKIKYPKSILSKINTKLSYFPLYMTRIWFIEYIVIRAEPLDVFNNLSFFAVGKLQDKITRWPFPSSEFNIKLSP